MAELPLRAYGVHTEGKRITEMQFQVLARDGYEFTFDNPAAAPSWGKVDFTTASYMGLKVFLSNNKTKMSGYIRGIKSPEGIIEAVKIVRD